MSYSGVVVPIPLGQMGLQTDNSPSAIPPTALITANNVTCQINLIEKVPGSARLNKTAITGGVYANFDFWPTTLPTNQRLVILGGDGKLWQMDSSGTIATVASSGGIATLGFNNQAMFVSGGIESASNVKKLFLFNGTDAVQQISGSPLVHATIGNPAADWSGANQPSFGLVYRNRLWAGGNLNNPHQLYASLATDHENFSDAAALTFSVYPGEGERLIGACIYKGRLFVFKYPTGIYYLVDSDNSATNWYFTQSTSAFGFASGHSVVPVLNDVLIKNASDAITSVQATRDFGDIAAGDTLTILKIEQYVRDNTNASAAPHTHAIYYPAKKLAMFTYQSPQGSSNDRILMFRTDTNTPPKATFLTKDAPNCMALRKDSTLIERPIYGSLDGFVYQMDVNNYDVNGSAYIGEFQTPHMDFGFHDYTSFKGPVDFTSKNKNFDFLELRYVPQGNWKLSADTYIDGNFYETIQFDLSGGATLADVNPDPNDFILSSSSTDPTGSFLSDDTNLLSSRKRIRGTGRTISVRFYNSGLDQGFKIATMIFSFRLSGEQQR